MTRTLFTNAGLYTAAVYDKHGEVASEASGCTNHAIRRTAIQWCGRCKGNPIDGKNNGRWKTYDEMAEYHAQGAVDRAQNTLGGAKDPIWAMWV